MKRLSWSLAIFAAVILSGDPARADLFVSNRGDNTVVRIDGQDRQTVFASGLNQPEGIAFDSSGNMYVANAGNNTIVEFSPSGQSLGVFASTHLVEPWGLAFNAAGDLYVANFGPGDPPFAIFSPTGQYLGTLSQRFSDAAGVAFDASGNLYVTNSLGYTISVISPTGQSLPSFGSVTNPVFDPLGLAFDSSGNLYTSTSGNNTVVRFSPSGTNLGTFASTGLDFPVGLAFDSAGDLYVANWGDPLHSTGTISEFSSSGQYLGNIATGLASPQFLAFQPSDSQPIATPEPESLVLLVMGLTGGFLVSRRHRKQAGSRGGGKEGRRGTSPS